MAVRGSGEGEPDGGLAGVVAIDADRDAADEPSAGGECRASGVASVQRDGDVRLLEAGAARGQLVQQQPVSAGDLADVLRGGPG
ncbi:hypothetical protein [Georgenia yuyongxinii]